MRTIRLAAVAALVLGAMSVPASADLVLVSGTGPATLTNNYGYTGKYYDKESGTAVDESHPGGGPVAVLFVITNSGVSIYFDSKAGPYDNSDDAQVGVVNNSSQAITNFVLSATTNIFGFDGDGIGSSPYNAPTNSSDTSDGKYGGPLAYFTNINAAKTSGTVNFINGGLAAGANTYFSLEGAPSMATLPAFNSPEPSTMAMAVGGVMVMALGYLRRRRAAVKS